MRRGLCRAALVLGAFAVLTGLGVLRILDDPRLPGPPARPERHAAIRRVLDGAIDFPDAARRTLGPSWRDRSQTERTEFVGLFRELVPYSYITRIELYAGERSSTCRSRAETAPPSARNS